jgi:hypothetical protein
MKRLLLILCCIIMFSCGDDKPSNVNNQNEETTESVYNAYSCKTIEQLNAIEKEKDLCYTLTSNSTADCYKIAIKKWCKNDKTNN